AHYADTHGYDDDGVREMWPWRDWAINAYNRNLPYDQFTIKQIAGDLLPAATLEDKIATGFFRNHMINNEDPERSHVEYVVDRVSTLGTTWMGLTVGCARCHDHKYDPIKQKDFYRLFAYFNTIPEAGGVDDDRDGNAVPVVALPSPQQAQQMESLERAIGAALAQLPEKAVVDQENQWQQSALPGIPAPPQAGLTAYYEFEDKLVDSTGHNPDAKVAVGEVGYQFGSINKSLELSGATVDFPGAGDFDRDRPFAIALWVDGHRNFGRTRGMELLQKSDDTANWRGYEISLDDAAFINSQDIG